MDYITLFYALIMFFTGLMKTQNTGCQFPSFPPKKGSDHDRDFKDGSVIEVKLNLKKPFDIGHTAIPHSLDKLPLPPFLFIFSWMIYDRSP